MKAQEGYLIGTKRKPWVDILLGLLTVLWFLPIIFVIICSMKTRQEYNLTQFWVFPEKIAWSENFAFITTYSDILSSLGNSLLYAVVGGLGSLVLAALAAYGIAKLNIKHRLFWFLLIYSGTIFPFQMYLVPIFKAYMTLNLYDTKLGLMLLYIAICIPYIMFLLHNQFLSIPKEMLESAVMDGAGSMRILLSIMLPMSKASLAVAFMTQFSYCYNELMFGMTFARSTSIKPVMTTISTFVTNIPARMMACILISIPTIILYIFLNRSFDTGISYQNK